MNGQLPNAIILESSIIGFCEALMQKPVEKCAKVTGKILKFFEDLQRVGMEREDFSSFMNSAEAFLQMWEKIEAKDERK